MNNTKNIMIVGVGGQGTLLASKLLGEVLLRQGYDVKVSEVHGMSQRGGSVVTYVRYGSSVASPVIETGEADLILAFELLEAARYLPYLKEGGRLISNRGRIDPMPVITGAAEYPKDLEKKLQKQPIEFLCCDALSMAEEAGTAKAVNVVLLGLLAKYMEFPKEVWLEALEKTVPQRFLELNRKAFLMSFEGDAQ